MADLEIVRQGWFSPTYSLYRDGTEIAEIICGRMETGSFRFENRQYGLSTHGWLRNRFILADAATPVAEASKTRWKAAYVVRHEGRSYDLKSVSFWKRSFVLLENGEQTGTIIPRVGLRRRANISLPDDLPMPLRMFLIWLAILQWDRDSAMAGA